MAKLSQSLKSLVHAGSKNQLLHERCLQNGVPWMFFPTNQSTAFVGTSQAESLFLGSHLYRDGYGDRPKTPILLGRSSRNGENLGCLVQTQNCHFIHPSQAESRFFFRLGACPGLQRKEETANPPERGASNGPSSPLPLCFGSRDRSSGSEGTKQVFPRLLSRQEYQGFCLFSLWMVWTYQSFLRFQLLYRGLSCLQLHTQCFEMG